MKALKSVIKHHVAFAGSSVSLFQPSEFAQSLSLKEVHPGVSQTFWNNINEAGRALQIDPSEIHNRTAPLQWGSKYHFLDATRPGKFNVMMFGYGLMRAYAYILVLFKIYVRTN